MRKSLKPWLNNPQVTSIFSELKRWLSSNEDDDFFHLTCHVDPALRSKIEQGAFVDLSKLLPKTRFQELSEEQRMQLLTKNGQYYWIPETDQKVTGVHKWEQAFRVFATIYCKVHPLRSSEIWQYIYVINTATASYQWENVAYYDFTFRHLMEQNPERSWPKVYNQLWNLVMCDPLSKGQNSNVHSSGISATKDSSGSRNWHDRCCWQYNRGTKCKKWPCHFDDHCNYCRSWQHGVHECPKKKNNNSHDRDREDSPCCKHKK